jgi:hypothetical protein
MAPGRGWLDGEVAGRGGGGVFFARCGEILPVEAERGEVGAGADWGVPDREGVCPLAARGGCSGTLPLFASAEENGTSGSAATTGDGSAEGGAVPGAPAAAEEE